MRWSPGARSKNIEDRRGRGGVRRRGTPLSLGGILILLVLSVVFKQDFFALLGNESGLSPGVLQTSSSSAPRTTAEEESLVDFVSFVLDDVQAVWTEVLAENGSRYRDAKLVLFRDSVSSACGMAGSASGPFYCPGDEKVYIDLGFYSELRDRFGAAGDFAQAYVLAHEIGHHVQNITGVEQMVRRRQRASPAEAKELSVMMELQADCLAGIWGHSTGERGILERGDVDEGLNAAASIGDDRLQKMSGQHVNPDNFTHGSSAQRVEWFRRGLASGNPDDCETFERR
jgi:predicted metalloprotease